MATDPLPRSSHASSPSRRIASVIYRSLKTVLAQQSPRRCADDITLHRLRRTAANQLMRLRLECRDLVQMNVSITTTHVEKNIYDVVCKNEDGASRRVSYALPVGTGTAIRAPGLAQKLGRFLVDELERLLGHRSPSTDEKISAAE